MSLTGVSSAWRIGVDIGGTFTDLVAVDAEGRVHRAKTPTTPDDYSRGVLTGLERLVGETGGTLPELLASVDAFTNATTIVTNAVAELRGRRVGVITTRGFGDTLPIARSARTNDPDLHTQVPMPDLVARGDVAEVDERVDYAGRVVVALDEDQVVAAGRALREAGCEALVVCFLWSFAHPAHERRAAELLTGDGDGPVWTSSEVLPVAREYERFVTTALNAFASSGVAEYLDALEDGLARAGLREAIALMQSEGGLISGAQARRRPIELVESGPVGGVVGARALAAQLGLADVLTADMGGTSFDAALVKDGDIGITHRAHVGRFATGLSTVDISIIGAGGGSLLRVDGRGTLQLGPESAGAVPGPACYGAGGTEPTLTDVAVAAGLIDPAFFLGGSIELDGEAAERVVDRLAAQLGWDRARTLAGAQALGVGRMADSLREISVRRGHDPRDFTLFAYGGATALFAASIGIELGAGDLLVPRQASVFSAFGLLWGDARRSAVRTVNWDVAEGDAEVLTRAVDEVSAAAFTALGSDAEADAEAVRLEVEADLRFAGQAYEVTIPLPADAARDRDALAARFTARYEQLFGPGTAWTDSPVVLLNVRAVAARPAQHPPLPTSPPGPPDPGDAIVGRRPVVLPGGPADALVVRGEALRSGMRVEGPAVVEELDTTVVVPPGVVLEVDAHGNHRMDLREAR